MCVKLIGLLGLPGAGKTTAMEHITERSDLNATGLQMKTIAADEYWTVEENGLDAFPCEMQREFERRDLTDTVLPSGEFGAEIGEWVDIVLSVDETYFAQRAANRIETDISADVVVVDGIRSVPDAEWLSTATEQSLFIYLHTPFSVRLTRLQQRNRSGEEDIDAEQLLARDEQELSWGVDAILSEYQSSPTYEKRFPVEFFHATHKSVSEFTNELDCFINELL